MVDKNFAVIIPTKNRPKDIKNLLGSIAQQENRPGQIIIVDSGDTPLDRVISEFKDMKIVYVKHKPPSLTVQRNIGLGLLEKDIGIVAFFDDDLILCSGAVKTVLQFWLKASPDTVGVSLNAVNHPKNNTSFLERFFLISTNKVGTVLPSGFQSNMCSVDRDYEVQWLMGGATFWKRNIFDKYKFDESFHGYAHCEDLDFSHRLSKKYRLFVLKDAKFIHNTKPIEEKYEYHLGKMQAMNRIYFVKKNPWCSLLLCYWSCTGLFLKNLFMGTINRKPRYFRRALGVLVGMFNSLVRHQKIKEGIKL